MNTRTSHRGWFWLWSVVALICAFSMTGIGFAQTILYVDDDAPDGGDGLSWDTAFNDLQDALDEDSGIGTFEIRIGQGRYVPSLLVDPKDARSATFALRSSLILKGGYAGYGAPDSSAWNPETYASILDGDLLGNDQPDLVNYEENTYHVLSANVILGTATLNGLVVRGGNADVDAGTDVATHLGGGLFLRWGGVTILNCTFVENHALYGGAIYARQDGALTLTASSFSHNHASEIAGAVRVILNGTLVASSCTFHQNTSQHSGGAIAGHEGVVMTLQQCEFQDNECPGGAGGAIFQDNDDLCALNVASCAFLSNSSGISGGALHGGNIHALVNCVFQNNSSYAGGALTITDGNSKVAAAVANCEFHGNDAELFGGAILNSSWNAHLKNCVVTSNSSALGGGIAAGAPIHLSNCSVANNTTGGVAVMGQWGDMAAANCVFWGNSGYQVAYDNPDDPPPPLAGTIYPLSHCNVQGGYPGEGNINADPLFIQPGCGNLRLGIGSPCIDAGDNSAIPDGITTDLDGNPRIINAIVDMGAYEGEHEMLPPAACDGDIDEGEFAQLTPQGGPFNPLLKPAVTIINETAGNNAYATLTEFQSKLHSGAGGFNELGSELSLETSLLPGAYFSRVFISFDQSNLNGFDPLDLDLTYFNESSGVYELAAASNIQNSPDHKGPLGDRQVLVGTAWQGQLSFDIGDYGVFWNPDQQKGFAWANVDHASDFAFGIPLPECTGDCTYPSDGVVNVSDLTILLDNWGITPAGPASFADITPVGGNGIIDVDDLVTLINAWGACK